MKTFVFIMISALAITLALNVPISHTPQTTQDPQVELFASGPTRTRIGQQVYWTTDLVPSSSFNVNLGSPTDQVQKIFGVGASLSGNLSFLGEIKPDNELCTNGQILKKTGANNWDCATDSTGSGGSSIGVRESGNSFTNVSSISFSSSGFNVSFPAEAYIDIDYINGPASRTLANTWTARNTFTASPVGVVISNSASISANLEVTGYASLSNAFYSSPTNGRVGLGTNVPLAQLDISNATPRLRFSDTDADDYSILAASNEFLFYDETAGRYSISTNSVRTIFLSNDNEKFKVVPSGASVSGNFEVTGFASASRFFGGYASHSFAGTIEGPSNNTLSLGTTAKSLKQLVAGIVKAVIQFFFPTTTSNVATLTIAGEAIVNTASGSLDFYDGTNQRILRSTSCFTFKDPITSKAQFPGKKFLDPFTITSISPVASSSNSATWNFRTGAPGSVTTNIFTLNKMASTSTYPNYNSFAVSTIGDGAMLDFVTVSASATVKLSVTVCGRYTK